MQFDAKSLFAIRVNKDLEILILTPLAVPYHMFWHRQWAGCDTETVTNIPPLITVKRRVKMVVWIKLGILGCFVQCQFYRFLQAYWIGLLMRTEVHMHHFQPHSPDGRTKSIPIIYQIHCIREHRSLASGPFGGSGCQTIVFVGGNNQTLIILAQHTSRPS